LKDIKKRKDGSELDFELLQIKIKAAYQTFEKNGFMNLSDLEDL
jgi:hypothetical protein